MKGHLTAGVFGLGVVKVDVRITRTLLFGGVMVLFPRRFALNNFRYDHWPVKRLIRATVE